MLASTRFNSKTYQAMIQFRNMAQPTTKSDTIPNLPCTVVGENL
jgi:hypothetical protein